jgi:hypothetical protein
MIVSLDNNFWKDNSDLLLVEEFGQLYQKDKSKNKEESSKIMKAIYYVLHPESVYYNSPTKYEIISKSFLKDPKFNWDSIQSIVLAFKEFVLSDVQKALINWGEIMVMRDTTLKKLYKDALAVSVHDVDTKTLKDLDSMLTATPKMFEDYKKIKKEYEEELVKKKGKKNRSLSDLGEL